MNKSARRVPLTHNTKFRAALHPGMDARTQRSAERIRAQSRILPDVQLGTTGQTISIADSVVSSIVLAAALGAMAWLFGTDPVSMVHRK